MDQLPKKVASNEKILEDISTRMDSFASTIKTSIALIKW
jgi:hypothetical protein